MRFFGENLRTLCFRLMLFTILLPACGIKVGNPIEGEEEEESEAQSIRLSGYAIKGQIYSAEITVYEFLPLGEWGEIIATAVTDEDGFFIYELTAKQASSPIVIVSNGGLYIDEATGVEVTIDAKETLTVTITKARSEEPNIISPLTTLAAAIAISGSDDLTTEISDSHQTISELFELDSVDITKTLPLDLTAEKDGADPESAVFQYGLVLSSITQLIHDQGHGVEATMGFIQHMAKDMADGKLDGKGKKGKISYAENLSYEVLEKISKAKENFLSGDRNKSGIDHSQQIGKTNAGVKSKLRKPSKEKNSEKGKE